VYSAAVERCESKILQEPPTAHPMSIRRLAVRIEDEGAYGKEGNMRRVIAFEQVSLDGFFVDGKGDMSWAHKQDPEWNAFTSGNASGDGALIFGRVTYEMMASFWPTPMAMESMPEVAEGMNRMPKIVFSRTLKKVSWDNTTLVNGDVAAHVRKLKNEPGPGLAILGSGSIVSQLARAGLVDEFQIVVNPIVLGKGRTLFEGVEEKLPLKLTQSRAFGNGNVVLYYQPVA
jgi:dihydrofolate reductase